MKITVRGWARDMGTKEMVDIELYDTSIKEDAQRCIFRNEPGIFTAPGRTFIAWFQNLRHMGQYRMEIELSNKDLLRLFKAKFGTELREWLVDDEGFTISAELTKRALRTVKLADVTLADLAAMSATPTEDSPTAEKLADKSNLTPLRRIPFKVRARN
jgi:hypothetical protein